MSREVMAMSRTRQRSCAPRRRVRKNVLTQEQHREGAEARILFDMLQRMAGRRHWKSPFEVHFALASRVTQDPPVPREAVRDLARKLLQSINFHHAGAMVLDLEAGTARPTRGEPAAYVTFDGYDLVVGSTGYAG